MLLMDRRSWTRSGTDPASPADTIEPLFEIPPKHNVLRVTIRICPYGSEPSHEGRNPIGGLDGLITMAFEVEQGFDEVPTPVGSRVHTPRHFGNQRGPLIVFVKSQKEIGRRVAVHLTELIDPLDCLEKDPRIEAIRMPGPIFPGR